MRQLLSDIALIPEKNHRAQTFERVVKWLLENAPEVRDQFKKVWLWSEYPDAKGADLGIDLVAETRQGSRYAIQAKCYGADQTVPWGKLSTFYGDALGREEIDQLLLVTTTDLISSNAKKQLDRSSKPSAIWARADLLKFGIDASLESLDKPERTERFDPRPHQQEAIDAAVTHLKRKKRGQLLMACGTGKTLTGLWIREAMNAKRTVVFVPSIALLRQTWSSWNQHANEPFYSITICSDERATSRGKDRLVTSPSAAGLPPTTDPDAIAKALDVRGPIVVFSTYQSSEVLEEALKKAGRAFDLMIGDEAHNTTSAGLTSFTRPLYDKHVPAKRRLFCTATPRIISRKGTKKDGEETYDIHSMDNEELYGEIAYKLTFSEAIERKLLHDYEVFVVGVDDMEIGDTIRERHYLDMNGTRIDAEELAAHIAIQRAMKKRGTRRLISFHNRVNHAEQFAKNVPIVAEWLRANRRRPVKNIWSEAVSGEMPVVAREAVLHRLETQEDDVHGIVSNARCLGEGVDVPTIDGITFVEPKRSTIDIVQAVGRAIRRSEQKGKRSTIVLPVPISSTQNPEDTLNSSAFETVWRVLEALRAHDDVLSESLDALRTQLGQRAKAKIQLPKLTIDLPRAVGASFADAISLKLIERTTSSFWEGLGYLKAYNETHGDSRVPQKFKTEDGFNLGTWMNTRRMDHGEGRLSQERIEALNELGFIWDVRENDFQEGLGYLKAHKGKHGDCRVPQKFKTEDGFNLGVWMNTRRMDHGEGRLSQERIEALNELGFIWDTREYDFQEGLGYLKAHKAKHGDCRVPRKFKTEDGFNLGAWMKNKRVERGRRRLPQERIDALNELGFIWDTREYDFQEGLGYLNAYRAKHGDCRVPKKFKTEDGFNLGAWMDTRRMEQREGRLSQERIEALNELGFIWDVRENDFQGGLGYLNAYRAKHGDCRVPATFKTEDGFNLGSWMNTRRMEHGEGRLSQERIDGLNELGFIWDPYEYDFQEGLGYLKAYKRKHGDCRVPRKFKTEDGFILGAWVKTRRLGRGRERLSQEQIDGLNELGFIWDVVEENFQEGLGHLKAYRAKHGDCRVPQKFKTEDGFNLGTWCPYRRKGKKEGSLAQEWIDALNELGFIWDPHEENFQEGLGHLKAYRAKHGDCRVPRSFEAEEGFHLGAWVKSRRQDYRKGKLSKERIDALEALGVDL